MTKAKPKNCPTCQKPSTEKFRPFCSARCADIDLGKWLNERFRVATDEKPQPEQAPGEDD